MQEGVRVVLAAHKGCSMNNPNLGKGILQDVTSSKSSYVLKLPLDLYYNKPRYFVWRCHVNNNQCGKDIYNKQHNTMDLKYLSDIYTVVDS